MILVTGGTGQVGSALIERLETSQVRALAHSDTGRLRLTGVGVEIVGGDLDRPESLAPALAGCDRLFLLSPPHPDQVAREQAAIAAAVEAGVEHVVALSVLGAEPNSLAAFARWHSEIDATLASSGLSYTILRPAGFMQTHLWPVQTITTQSAWYGMTGDGAMAFIDFEDIAEVAAAVLTADEPQTGVVELTGPQAVSMPQAAAIVADVTGHPVSYVEVPPQGFRQALSSVGLADYVVDGIIATYEAIRAGHATTVSNWVQRLAGRPPRSYGEFVETHRDELVPASDPS